MFQSLFSSVVSDIEINRNKRIAGLHNHIPGPFPSLNKYWAGFIPGQHVLLTAGSGIGKSRYALQNFVLWPLDWALSKNYNVKLIFFPLEDSVNKIIRRLIIRRLYTTYGIGIGLSELNQYVEYGYMEGRIMDSIRELERSEYIKNLEGRLYMESGMATPKAMFARICNIMATDGQFEMTNTDGKKMPTGFRSDNNTHWIIVCDNLNNISPADHGTKNEAIIVWTRDYVRELLCNRFGCTVIDIQQQMPTKETMTFTNTGAAVIQKLLPSIDGLGEAKATSQTAHIILGLFSPARYDLMTCPIGYDTGKLGNYYRHLKLLKSNDGEAPVELGLFYDGLVESWSEMPSKDDIAKMNSIYGYIEKLENKRNPQPRKSLFE